MNEPASVALPAPSSQPHVAARASGERRTAIVVALITLAVIACGAAYFAPGKTVSTDDAYVQGNVLLITPQIILKKKKLPASQSAFHSH